MITAIAGEALAERGYLQGEMVETIYFGGGTPSLLDEKDCQVLIAGLLRNYPVSPTAEITLEANPDDLTAEKLEAWKAAGVNRLSIGVQSFFDEELRWMNRAHTAEQSVKNLTLALRYFDNITIDLIYGSPLLTDAMWKENVDRATGMGIPHLSCYALTVEEKTPLHHSIRQKKTVDVDTDRQASQFLMLMEWLHGLGYEHYEVSNFARPSYRSRHNSSYWQGRPYLGLGPSAHSYNGKERRWNVANNSLYLQDVIGNRETEVLTQTQRLNEYLMIALRTKEGIDLKRLQDWGEGEKGRVIQLAQTYLSRGDLKIENDALMLTDEGMLLADGIASHLFR